MVDTRAGGASLLVDEIDAIPDRAQLTDRRLAGFLREATVDEIGPTTPVRYFAWARERGMAFNCALGDLRLLRRGLNEALTRAKSSFRVWYALPAAQPGEKRPFTPIRSGCLWVIHDAEGNCLTTLPWKTWQAILADACVEDRVWHATKDTAVDIAKHGRAPLQKQAEFFQTMPRTLVSKYGSDDDLAAQIEVGDVMGRREDWRRNHEADARRIAVAAAARAAKAVVQHLKLQHRFALYQ